MWSDLVGYYAPAPGFLTNLRTWQMTGGEIEVVVRDRRLVVRSLSPIPQLRKGVALRAADPGDPLRFVAEAEGLTVPVAFNRGPTGPATGVAIGPPSNTVFHRRSMVRSSGVRMRVAGAVATVAAAFLARRLMRVRGRRRPRP